MILFAFISISILCVKVFAASVNFPSLSSPRVWDDAIWKDCVTKEVVYPSNCKNTEDSWEECYLVPENGLCVKQNIEPSMYGRLHLALYLFNFTESTLSYEYNGVPVKERVQNDHLSIAFTHASPVFEFRIKTPEAKVQRFTVSQECAPNCKKCAEGKCDECEKGWDLFNQACEDPRCQNQLSSISNKILNSAEYSFQSGHYNLELRFGIPLDDCFTPRVYLTKNILNSSIHYVPSPDRIQLIDKVKLKIKLSMTEMEKYCQRFETKTKQISQCSIGVALTYHKMTQYKLIVLGRLVFDPTTQATKEFTQQVEVSSDQGSSAGEIIVMGEPVFQMLDPLTNTVKVVQKITDPIFMNFTLECLSGILLQSEDSQDMECQISEEIEVMKLKFDKSIDPSKDFSVLVKSELVPPKRRLLQEYSSRSAKLKFILKTEDQGEYAEGFFDSIFEIWHINAIAIAGLILLLVITAKLMVYKLARQTAILSVQKVEVSRIAEELPKSEIQGVQRESSAGIPQSTNTNRHGTQGIILQSIVV